MGHVQHLWNYGGIIDVNWFLLNLIGKIGELPLEWQLPGKIMLSVIFSLEYVDFNR